MKNKPLYISLFIVSALITFGTLNAQAQEQTASAEPTVTVSPQDTFEGDPIIVPEVTTTPTATPTVERSEQPKKPVRKHVTATPVPAPTQDPWEDGGYLCDEFKANAIPQGWYVISCDPLRVMSVDEARQKGLLP